MLPISAGHGTSLGEEECRAMKILIVASHNKGYFAPFIEEQAAALKRSGYEIEFFGVTGKGIKGYIAALSKLRKYIRSFKPDIVHAHYGLSGLLANLQRKVPVVTTYHGSDINEKSVLPFSRVAMRLSRFNIFVSQRTLEIAKPKKNYVLLPCGVDLNELQLTTKSEARKRLGLAEDRKYVLFAGAFDNPVKNYPLAKDAMSKLPEAKLIELKGYSRDEVTLLMCAADAILMTSHTEGSPQVIKESMACGCPVVSVDVGDVKELCGGIPGCFVCERSAKALSDGLSAAFGYERTEGRKRIIERGLSNDLTTTKIMSIYNNI